MLVAGTAAKVVTAGAQRQVAVAPADAAERQMARAKSIHGDHGDAVSCRRLDYSNRMAKLKEPRLSVESNIPPLLMMSIIEIF